MHSIAFIFRSSYLGGSREDDEEDEEEEQVEAALPSNGEMTLEIAAWIFRHSMTRPGNLCNGFNKISASLDVGPNFIVLCLLLPAP